ncbi:gamma-interferon-inducible lysosomal thiol reductase [Trichonephila clavipes]|uniref:Gamma-interferon-inducible lysosomal thiol reductase n=1 Tax=Trichonephila clavipes TaxID=2585209 RepID=A0A8X6VVI8_TRICX|nr:gamma-interferon-inducible lysosomal thiol reductase [Trichonephila clavipes]
MLLSSINNNYESPLDLRKDKNGASEIPLCTLIHYENLSENVKALFDEISQKYEFQCHHGPRECYGNTVQGCAISLYPDTETHLNFINCMESYPRPSESGPKCARRLSLDWKSISKCADGEAGKQILYKNSELTKELQPSLTFVPWINVNKVHSDSIQRRALRDLKSVVCDAHERSAAEPVTCNITGQRYASLLEQSVIPALQTRRCDTTTEYMQDVVVGNLVDNILESLEMSWMNYLFDSFYKVLGWMKMGLSQAAAARSSQTGSQCDPTTLGSIGI